MDHSMKDRVKGTAEVVKGKVEQATGKLIDDKTMQAHGIADEAMGKARRAAAKVEETAEDYADRKKMK